MIIQSDFSILKSTLTTSKALNLLKENGYSAFILADDTLSGAVEFYKKAKSMDLMPIIGLQKVIQGVKYLLIAHNWNGYSSLTKGETLGFDENIFKDLNVTAIAVDILEPNYKIHSEYALKKPEERPADKAVNKVFEKECKVFPFSIINAESEKDYYTLGILKAIADNTTYELVLARKEIVCSPFFSHEKMVEDLKKAGLLKEFSSIIKKCVDDYKFGDPVPPSFREDLRIPLAKSIGLSEEIADDATVFETLCKRGLVQRAKDGQISTDSDGLPTKEYWDRLEYEMKVIKDMKFPGYFLIVRDFINFAKERDIPVGPGRGSAAGALVSYALRITDLDPMKHGLIFERFLNPARVSLPDIDTDFCQKRRKEVIDYVIDRYGFYNVAQVITFGTIGAKNGIRDAARAIGAPLALADKLAKMVPEKPGISLAEAYEQNKVAFDEFFANDDLAKLVWQEAEKIEGLKRNLGVHAAGLVISNDEIYSRAPLYEVNDSHVIGYAGNYLEDVDLVKYDFLGLKTLTQIDDTIELISRTVKKPKEYIYSEMVKNYNNDPEVYKFISSGKTKGIFQIESDGMRSLAQRLQPQDFEELTAMLALYRPGPMESGMLDSFVKRKHGQEEVDYFFDSMREALEPILKPTYGMIVYQEQVMQIVQAIAGFDLGEADLVRRAMGKKKKEEMERIKGEFVKRAVEKGYKEEESAKLFELIEKFAGYGFNKSHSAAYAYIAYQTAWLKYHYPIEFMTALLNHELDNTDKVVEYIKEARAMGINIVMPDIKKCKEKFEPQPNEKTIVYGLKAIKGVGGGSKVLINYIEKNPDTALVDMLFNINRDISKEIKSLESEIKKIDRKIASDNKKLEKLKEAVDKLEAKARQKALTQRESDSLAKKQQQIVELTQEITNLTQNKTTYLNQISSLEQEKTESSFEKLNKRVFEALVKAGAFDSFGYTRKDLLENTALLLNPNTIKSFKPTGEEFSISEKLAFEKEVAGMFLSPLFDSKKESFYKKYIIPADKPLGILIDKMPKKTKGGKDYFIVKIIDNKNNEISVFDFDSKSKDIEIGSFVSLEISQNGDFTHLRKIQRITKESILESLYEKRVLVKQIELYQSIEDEDLSVFDRIVVVDKNGNLILELVS